MNHVLSTVFHHNIKILLLHCNDILSLFNGRFFRPLFFPHIDLFLERTNFSLVCYELQTIRIKVLGHACVLDSLLSHTHTYSFYLSFEIRLKKYIYELSHLSHVLAHDKNKSEQRKTTKCTRQSHNKL